jgi:Ino eighty subunit 2
VWGAKTDETSRKKKQLNEAEIALRREETARKRKHLSEKKLEDEKVRISSSFHKHRTPFPDARTSIYTRRRRSIVY